MTDVRGINSYIGTLVKEDDKKIVLADEMSELRQAQTLIRSLRVHMATQRLSGKFDEAAHTETLMQSVQRAVVQRLDALSATAIQ